MPADITKQGVSGLKGLRGVNTLPTSEELDYTLRMATTGRGAPSLQDTTSIHPYDLDSQMGQWGTSKYDDTLLNAPLTDSQIQDTRYENQPWYDSLANGVVKMLGTAGTTFLSSLVGLPAGAATAINEGRWSGLWDNDVTQALGDVDDWLENNFQNYKSGAQEQNKWWQNMGTMNWWADDVIKNAGFTLGAAASMATGAGALGLMSKALGLVNNVSKGAKIANGFVSALFSATGEGMIEARQGVEERNKLELQKLEDSFAPERNALEMEKDMIDQEYSVTGDFNAYQRKMTDVINREKELEGRLEAGKQQIEESGREMGNKILLGNQALLTAGNLIQFGKVMTKSFDRARHAAELSSKSVKPSLVRAAKVGEDAAKGYAIKGKNLGKAWALGKGLITEGSEEMNQQWIQSSAGAAYNEKDVNDYWRAKLDPEAYRETTRDLYSLGNTINQGFQDSWGDADQWEQFVIGGMTGMAGTYMPSKIFNQDKTKALYDPRRYGEWSGGAINELNEFNDQYRQYEENIDDLNKALQDKNFFTRIQSLAARTYAEGKKQKALEENDKKTWKDEDDKQTVHDIQAFLRAGKLDDLRAIYNDMSGELSDEDVEAIRKNTTREIENEDGTKSYEGPFVDKEGNQIVSNEEIKAEVKKNATKLQQRLDSYLDSIDEVNNRTNGVLTKEQEDNLAYLNFVSKRKEERFNDIMKDVRKELPTKFYIRTNQTPEQLTRQYASSDLAFAKNDATPEGYVEVDTSMMNDNNFGAFFADTILWGNNIYPSYTKEELIEELEAKEEDKKYSKEEQEKRREERDKKRNENKAKKEKKAEEERVEQQEKNLQLIKQAIVDNALYKEGKSLTQALQDDKLNNIIKTINEALQLRNEEAEYENTLHEYMANPEKVEQAKKQVEKEAENKQRNKEVDGFSLNDMLEKPDAENIKTIKDSKKGKNNKGNMAKTAVGLNNTKFEVEKALDKAVDTGKLDKETAEDAKRLLEVQMDRYISSYDDTTDKLDSAADIVDKLLDTESEVMMDSDFLIDEATQNKINNGLDKTTLGLDERLLKAIDALNATKDAAKAKLEELIMDIDMDKISTTINEYEEKQNGPSEKAAEALKVENLDKTQMPTKARAKRNDEPEPLKPVSTILPTRTEVEEMRGNASGNDDSLRKDMRDGSKGKNNPEEEYKSGWHPWMTSTSEVGQYTNTPYEPNPNDPNAEFKKQRYDVIRQKLKDLGAYTAIKQGKVTEDMQVGFKVFKDVNDASGDFVIFITDSEGNVIGDMPSNDPRLDTSRRDVSMNALYEKIQEEWENATEEERASESGMSSKYTSTVDHLLVGKVLYQNNRQSVTKLMDGSDIAPKFAILTRAGMHTGRDKDDNPIIEEVHPPKEGTPGQPYVLIQTPKVYNGEGAFKYYAVPIKTMTVGEAIHGNTIFASVLKELLSNIKANKMSDAQASQLLKALLAVANVHVNLEAGSNTKKGLGIHVTTFDRKEGVEKHNTWPIFTGNREDMNIDSIVDALERFSINVSSSFINGNANRYKYPFTVQGKEVDYNKMIAEVSNTNAASPMTVNDWFTIRPLEEKGDGLQMLPEKDTKTEWKSIEPGTFYEVTATAKGTQRNWRVQLDGWRVYDENGKQITKDDNLHTKEEVEEAKRCLAEVWGLYYMKDKETPYAVQFDGDAFIYIPATGKFKTYEAIEKDPKYSWAKLKKGEKLSAREKYHLMDSFMQELGHDDAEYAALQQYSENAPRKGVNWDNTKNRETKPANSILPKFSSAITDYSYGGQDDMPTFYGILPSTGERFRVEIHKKSKRYLIWIDRAEPGQTNYEPGKAINYIPWDEEYNKVLEELGLPQEFINEIPKLDELNRNDVRNNTDTKDEYLEKKWGIIYGHNAPNYKIKYYTREVEKKLKEMEEDSKKYTLVRWDEEQGEYVEDTRNGDYYRDEQGTIHARVSNVNAGDEEVIKANEEAKFPKGKGPAFIPSTGAGNAVDRFIRDIFAGGDPLYGTKLENPEERKDAIEVAKAIYESFGNPNISEADAVNLVLAMHQMLDDINKKYQEKFGENAGEWEINSSGIVAEGMISFDKNNIVHVAGTIDLLLYNKKRGEYVIVDMKTHRRDIFKKDGNLKDDAVTRATLAHWRAQQTLYKTFLEKKYGIKISGIRILPLTVSYSTKYNETQYEINEDGVLTDKGIPVDIHPVYDGKLISIRPKEHVNYNVGQLPDSVKRLLPKSKPIVTKPVEEELPLKESLINLRDEIPEGRSLKEFVRKEYAEDKYVQGLVSIIEDNKGSENPVLMTSKSQALLLRALDTDAIHKVSQEALATANDVPVDIPIDNEEGNVEDTINDMFNNGQLDSSCRDIFDELPENTKRDITTVEGAAELFNERANEGDDVDEIVEAINNLPREVRHKKAIKAPYKVLDINRELQWLSKVLPQLSSERRLQIVKGLIKCSDGSDDFGRLQDGIILIGTQAGEGTVYHEAFHAVVQFLLNDDEIEKLYQAAVKKWGDLSPVVLEEKLADEFEYYIKGLDYETGAIRKFFKALWNAIKALFSNKTYIDTLFRNINNGVYSGREFKDDRNNAFVNILKEQREYTKDYAMLPVEDRTRIKEANIDSDVYNQMTKEQKEYMLHCVI